MLRNVVVPLLALAMGCAPKPLPPQEPVESPPRPPAQNGCLFPGCIPAGQGGIGPNPWFVGHRFVDDRLVGGISSIDLSFSHGSDTLPAGMYFRGSAPYAPCAYVDGAEKMGLCTEPTHAVIAGVFENIHLARAAMSVLSTSSLEPGYPLVAHSDELGMEDAREGIVIVLALHAHEAPAAASSKRLAKSEVVVLLDDAAAHAKLPPEGIRALGTRVRPSVVADVHAGSRHGGDYFPPDDNAAPTVMCTLEPGTPILANRKLMEFGYYDWLPTICPDGELGWVRWQATMMHATVVDARTMVQLVGAECDSPIFRTRVWPDVEKGVVFQGSDGGGGC